MQVQTDVAASPRASKKTRWLLPVLGMMLLSACAEGAPAGGEELSLAADGEDEVELEESTASLEVAPTDAQAARFLIQSTYGANAAEIAKVKQLGYAGWLEQQFATPRMDTHLGYIQRQGPIGCNPCSSRYINAAMETFWLQAVKGPDQLRQRLTFALSEIFVISALNSGLENERAHASYQDMLAANAFGNFRTLMQHVATHPAMGTYLSHIRNEKEDALTGRQPDENFAREVMQLFTIGLHQLNIDGTVKLDAKGQPIATYTRFDVEGMAKVFTGYSWGGADKTMNRFHGWPVNGQDSVRWDLQMQSYPQYHSLSEKRIVGGVIIPANTQADQTLKIALDTLFMHPNVGPFIGSQLIKRFVTSNPSKAYVTRVAQTFNDNGQGVRGDMKAVMRAVLLDAEARSATNLTVASWGKLREPIVRYANFMRAFNVSSTTGYYRIWNLEDPVRSIGQNPMRAPSVFNWFRPDYSPQGPVRQAGLLAPEFQIVHEGTATSWVNFIEEKSRRETSWGRANDQQWGVDVRDYLAADLTQEVSLASNAAALFDRLNLLLAANQLSSATKTVIVNALNGINASSESGRRSRVSTAITLVMSSPEYLIQK